MGTRDVDERLVAASLRAMADLISVLGAAKVCDWKLSKIFADGTAKCSSTVSSRPSTSENRPPPRSEAPMRPLITGAYRLWLLQRNYYSCSPGQWVFIDYFSSKDSRNILWRARESGGLGRGRRLVRELERAFGRIQGERDLWTSWDSDKTCFSSKTSCQERE